MYNSILFVVNVSISPVFLIAGFIGVLLCLLCINTSISNNEGKDVYKGEPQQFFGKPILFQTFVHSSNHQDPAGKFFSYFIKTIFYT